MTYRTVDEMLESTTMIEGENLIISDTGSTYDGVHAYTQIEVTKFGGLDPMVKIQRLTHVVNHEPSRHDSIMFRANTTDDLREMARFLIERADAIDANTPEDE